MAALELKALVVFNVGCNDIAVLPGAVTKKWGPLCVKGFR
jgi:hypothetical protein